MDYLDLQRKALSVHRERIAGHFIVNAALLCEWVRLGWMEPTDTVPPWWRIGAKGELQLMVAPRTVATFDANSEQRGRPALEGSPRPYPIHLLGANLEPHLLAVLRSDDA